MFVKQLTRTANHLIGSLPSLSGAEILIENNTAEIEWTHDKAVEPDQVSTSDVP